MTPATVHFIEPFRADQLETIVSAGYAIIVLKCGELMAEYRGPDPYKAVG